MRMRLPRVHAPARTVRVAEIINLSSSANALLRKRVLAMRAQGFDSRILCMDGPYVAALRKAGIPVHTVHLPRGLDPLRVLLSLAEIACYLRRHRIDLVHTHCSVPGVVGRIAAFVAGVPVILHTVHGFHFHEHSSRFQRMFAIAVERLCGLLTDTLLTQNRGDLELAERYGIGPRERRRVIGNGIDLSGFRPRRRRPPAEGLVTVTCVARLEPVKNHDMLFQAASLLRQRAERFRVCLVGDGALREPYRSRCRELGIEDVVEFLGYRDDIGEILSHTDIAVLTSIKEGMPRAVLEAMAMGVPVVATRAPGTREAVRHRETGLLVEVGDVDGLAASLSLLIGDAPLRAAMGQRARQVASEEFDERSVVESLLRIYRARTLWHGKGSAVALPGTCGDGLHTHSRARG